MKTILTLAISFTVVQLFLLVVAVAIGFLLHGVIDGLDIGTGILVGMVSTVASAYFFVQLMRLAPRIPGEEVNADDQDEEGEDDAAPELHITLPPLVRRGRRRRRR